ncbi:hypothetical protein Kkor_0867 [Kangiella koreensis DSM 16069]|uniref:Uncharacterized protein n=1 Tax=Kangiella koreensis (strain DSM 16069 / JCM 12317 / KCTC 12182 / SW-125) TaxID=523791 RepID=C7RAJ5_KANKD|nr:hypothetical protein Kkor_0867 [Kangiella koreensis DSM 16069]
MLIAEFLILPMGLIAIFLFDHSYVWIYLVFLFLFISIVINYVAFKTEKYEAFKKDS